MPARALLASSAVLVLLLACGGGTDAAPLPFSIKTSTWHCLGGPPPCTGGEPAVTTVSRGDTLLFLWQLVPHAGIPAIIVHVRPVCAPSWEVRGNAGVVVTLPLAPTCPDSVTVDSSSRLVVTIQANLWIVPADLPLGRYTVRNIQFLDPALFLSQGITVQ